MRSRDDRAASARSVSPRGGGQTAFFDRQARARRLSSATVVAFVVCFPVMYALQVASYRAVHHLLERSVVNFPLFNIAKALRGWLLVASVPLGLATATVIALVVTWTWFRASRNGSSIALDLGGRWIFTDTHHPDERRLINVVQEMAIAAAAPPPAVFVLDAEEGINAFAAGTSRSSAAIVLTRGALNYLTRDELQGLVAHEMSHIVNGDMVMNLRMAGMLSGLRALNRMVAGMAQCLGTAWLVPRRRPWLIDLIPLLLLFPLHLFLIPLLLDLVLLRLPIVAGSLGFLVARRLHAAANRLREELADASAVQFTRYHCGIAGVLKKIGGLPKGATIDHELAPQLCHMFFSSPLAPDGRATATHPPLLQRIRELDPGFIGNFRPPVPLSFSSGELYRLGQEALTHAGDTHNLRPYRIRAEELMARARRLNELYQSSGDSALRDDLRRLEIVRRDLWIDAGQAARDSGWGSRRALSSGAGSSPPSAPAQRPPRKSLRELLNSKFSFAPSAPEGLRYTVQALFIIHIALPWVAVNVLPFVVSMVILRLTGR
jgi:Zn-dependent protease with chaperone function